MPSFTLAASVEHFLPSLGSLLIASLWQGVALVLLTSFALRLLPNSSAALRSALWTGVLVLAAILPFGLFTFHAAPRSGHEAIWHARSALSTVLISAWVVAAVVRFAQLVASTIHLRQVVQRAKPLSLSPFVAAVVGSGGRSLCVCASQDVDRPSVAGFLHPCILLPPELPSAVSEVEIRHILLHEREHIRRHDHWINLLGQISMVLFPLSPALVWVNRRLALERELACDDQVLQSTGARKAYAACLARVAENSLARHGLALAIGILGSRRRSEDLSRRVERILAAPVLSAGRAQSRLAAGVLCASILGGTAVLAHSPELVSFAPVSEVSAASSVSAMRDWAPQPSLVKQALAFGRVVPASDCSFPRAQAFRTTMVKAVLYASAPSRSARRTGLHRFPKVDFFYRPKPVLTSWDRQDAAPAPENSPRGSVAPPRSVPVLFRVSSTDSDGDPAWFTAVRLPDGWVVVMI